MYRDGAVASKQRLQDIEISKVHGRQKRALPSFLLSISLVIILVWCLSTVYGSFQNINQFNPNQQITIKDPSSAPPLKDSINSNHHHSHHNINQQELFTKFQSLNDFFIQDDHSTNPGQFNVYDPKSAFGLIDRQPPHHWKRFHRKVTHLIEKQPPGVFHKVIWIARHGQGYHNVAESKFGTPWWNCHWSELNGDGNTVWGPDARLTTLGQEQARVAREAWSREINNGLRNPQIFISSPLSRAIETMNITGVWQRSRQHPIVKEHWRENIGLHTCDKRRSKSALLKDFPFLEFEAGFSEEDNLWTPDLQESDSQLDIRIRKALQQLFFELPGSDLDYISITAHSGVISSLLRVVGHRTFSIQTGGMIPLVIQARLNATPTGPPPPGPGNTKPECPKLG